MALSVNTNLMSLTAQRNLSRTQTGLATAMERLSSGLRVNSAKDDAAGLAIASRMEAQVRGLNVAIRNANDAISLSQTAEGGLAEVGNMLQRMRELAVQSANATNGDTDRDNLDAEYQALGAEVTRQINATKFNGIAVLATAGNQVFQVGANNGDTITVATTNLNAAGGAVPLAVAGDVQDATNATAAIDLVDDCTGCGDHDTGDLWCGAEPLPVGGEQPAGGGREPGGFPRAHHGRRLCHGDRQPDAFPDPATGRYGNGGPGQCNTAVGVITAAVTATGQVPGRDARFYPI